MRIGLIARAENTGLGIQTWEFARHMHPAKTLVVNLSRDRGFFPDRFPGATIVSGLPSRRHLQQFLDGLDVVFTAETPYNYDLFALAEQANVATVLQYNFEFLDYLQRPQLPRPTMLAAPSLWRIDDVPDAVHLPVPVALDRFPARLAPAHGRRFLHIVGRPAIHDRNGTRDLITALAFVRSQITVTFKCQDPQYVPNLLSGHRIPDNVDLIVDSSDAPNYWDNYRDGDVLVLPRRFGGLCLPANEALAAGMPVIMPNIDPNNTWLPASWLVPADQSGQFMARTMIDLHTVDHRALAAKIDEFATDPEFYANARRTSYRLAHQLSWHAQAAQYQRVLRSVTG